MNFGELLKLLSLKHTFTRKNILFLITVVKKKKKKEKNAVVKRRRVISNKTTMKTYRFRIDNIDVVNRDINVENDGAPNALHYELLMRTFVNAGINVKSFLELARSANDDDTLPNEFLTSTSGVIILGCPTPLTDTKKMLQVNITTDTGNGEGINQLALFKQVVRTVKF